MWRRVYDTLAKKAENRSNRRRFPPTFESSEAEWKKLFSPSISIRDPDAALRVFKEFVEGPGFVHVSSRTTELAPPTVAEDFWALSEARCRRKLSRQIRRRLLCGSCPIRDRVVTRIDSFITAYGTRAALVDLWTSHVTLFELLILLFDRSEFLAETIIRSPEALR
jgi:glutamine synthetase adenylyltransferase